MIVLNDKVFLKNNELNFPLTYEKIKEIFGNPNRVNKLKNIILTYYNLGLFFYTPDNLFIEQIDLSFVDNNNNSFYPRKRYCDELVINDIRIIKKKDIDKLTFDEIDRNEEESEGIIRIKINNYNICFKFNIENDELTNISFWV